MKQIALLSAVVATAFLSLSSRRSKTDEWKKVGIVGVDSGQVLVIDPCYLESEWVREGQGNSWAVEFWGRDEAKIQTEFGKTPISCKTAQEARDLASKIAAHCQREQLVVRTKVRSGATYDQCCDLTTSAGFGQLNYRKGHAGLGVVSTSGYGDGSYPVYARKNTEGRIVELRVFFDKDGAESKRFNQLVDKSRKQNKGK